MANQLRSLRAYLPIVPFSNEKLLVTFVDGNRYDFAYDPQRGSLYRDFEWREESLVTIHGDWTFLRMEDQAAAQDNSMAFYWCQPRSEAELQSPKPYRKRTFRQAYNWPPYLEKRPSGNYVDFILDTNYAVNRNTMNGYIEQARVEILYHLNQWSDDTTIVEEEYLSPQPFHMGLKMTRKPNPQAMRFTVPEFYNTQVYEIPQCLHGDVHQPELEAGTKRTDGVDTYLPAKQPRMTYKATPTTKWVTHCFEAIETPLENGMYHLRRLIAIAPPTDPVVTFP